MHEMSFKRLNLSILFYLNKKALSSELLRTSDSLNEGLPIKIVRKKFQR